MSTPIDPATRQRVLVVDDNPDAVAMLTDSLEDAGMTVLVALDGESAIERARHGAPDIILLDAMMPGMDGFQTCVRLKQVPELAAIPVVFMTGLSDTEHVIRGFNAGGVDYVTKPVVIEQLVARLRAHLANARLVSGARDALDLSGRAAFALDAIGAIGWRTPSAQVLLARLSPGGGTLPAPVVSKLLAAFARENAPAHGRVVIQAGESSGLAFSRIGRTQDGQLLVTVELADNASDADRLAARHGLTRREAEVLLWIARGKSNRDIGDILALSPRTVNKHLEHIYVKLGVENRASAAALATAALAGR
ncbi:MAG: response regulator [Gammaproteobacteria bacterium]